MSERYKFVEGHVHLITFAVVGDLLDTIMYGGAEGQIRTGDERAATIGLNVSGLSTLDFAGPEIDRLRNDEGKARLKERLIREAYEWTKYKLQ